MIDGHREKSERLEQFLLMLADRHVLEKKSKQVPVFDEFDTPWQIEYVCKECGWTCSEYTKIKECGKRVEILDFLCLPIDQVSEDTKK